MLGKIVLGILSGLILASNTAPVEPLFEGKRIELVVPYGPGGGSSLHARMIAALLEQELPGEPKILIRNIEGAGSIRGLNEFSRKARADGLTLAVLGSSSYFAYALDDPQVEYPLPEFIPILASPAGFVAYGRRDHGLTGDPERDVRHLQAHPPTLAADNATSTDMMIVYCYDLLDIDIHPVWGVSSGEARQAFQRGESQVNHDSFSMWDAELQPMLDEGLMVPLFTMGYRDANGDFGRDPNLPGVPSCPELYQLVHGRPLAGLALDAYEAMFEVRMAAAKVLVLPPGTPAEVVEVYSDAMARVVERPELQGRTARLALGGSYRQLVGKEAVDSHRSAAEISEAVRDELRAWLATRWGLTL